MRGCNLKWSVYSSIEGLVSREGHYCTLGEVLAHTTHEYLRTNWDSSIWNPRGVEAGPHILAPALLHSLPTLTSATLLHFFCFHPHTFSFSPVILFYTFKFGFSITSHACPSSILFVVPQSSEAAEADEGMSTCLFPLSFCPAQPARCQCAEEIEMR